MPSNQPPRASSVWPEMPFMRGPVGAQRLRDLIPALRSARQQVEKNKARVLAHDWARKRLCVILNLSDAKQWNGYVPPARDHLGVLAHNPVREALMELFKEVRAAEDLAGGE